jgi:NADH dehydrogenase [ubiquinone] 1 alpha subcomplex assembly factor 5
VHCTLLQFTRSEPHRLLLLKMNTFSVRAFIPPLRRRCVPLQATRRYAMQAPGAPTFEIFSNQHKWQQKERAAANVELSRSVDYLRDEVASRLCERILVCRFCSNISCSY